MVFSRFARSRDDFHEFKIDRMTATPPDPSTSAAEPRTAPADDRSPPSSMREPAKHRWAEPIAALLMALATLGTAWCSYESAGWTRKGNRLFNEYNSLERKAGLLSVQGMQSATIHTAMFMQVLAAKQAGNEKLADFYVQRFPPDVRKAYDAWMTQKPFENPKADPHPFVPGLYEIRGTREAAEASATGADKLKDARMAG